MAAVGGTTLGNIMGVKDEPNLGAEGQKNEVLETNYKADSQFASHMKKTEGSSNFARTRTLKEQREYLPAFAVREDLMKTIRENQGESIRLCTSLIPVFDVLCLACSDHRCWGDGFRKDHSVGPIPIRRRVLQSWNHRMYTTSTCGGHVRGEASQRRDGSESL
jgi:hypothetical protein